MKTFLRLGEIPKNEKSINFTKINSQLNEDFTDLLKYDADYAYSKIPHSAFEEGVSVFELDKNGMPILSNLKLVKSFLLRFNTQKAFEVTGEQIGTGIDNEPLIKNVQIIKNRHLTQNKFRDFILRTLIKNFKFSDKIEHSTGNYKIYEFTTYEKINLITGEKVDKYEDVANPKDWVNLAPRNEYYFDGWKFSEPIGNFADEYK